MNNINRNLIIKYGHKMKLYKKKTTGFCHRLCPYDRHLSGYLFFKIVPRSWKSGFLNQMKTSQNYGLT